MKETEYIEWKQKISKDAIQQPFLDRFVAEGISTFQKNHPDLSGEYQGKVEKLEFELKDERTRNMVFRKLSEAKLPTDILEGYDFVDEDHLDEKVGKLKSLVEQREVAEANRLLAGASRPGSGNPKDTSAIDIRGLGRNEAEHLERTGFLDKLLRAQGRKK